MRVVLSVFGAAMATTTALGQCAPAVVYTNYNSLPSSIVPGTAPGARFVGGAAPGIAFQHVAVSPNGAYWALRGAATTTTGHVVVRGTARTREGAQLVARRTVTQVLGVRTCDTIAEIVDVANNGSVAFTGDLSGSITDDSFSAVWNNGLTFFAREGLPVPSLNFGFGTQNANPTILENGQIRHVSTALVGSNTQAALVSLSSATTGSVLALTGVTVPSGQLVAPAQTLFTLGVARPAVSSDGVDMLTGSALSGPGSSDAVLLYNNQVLAQEGAVIAGSGVSAAFAQLSSGNTPLSCSPTGGHCMARVTFVNATDAVMRIEAGAVMGMYAKRGDEITPGAGERYSQTETTETFLASAVASNGDYVIVGYTDAAEQLRDTVLVFNGSTVLLREGAEFDLNEDGVLNDNAFVGAFSRDGLALSDTGDVYVVVSVRGAAANVTGTALLTLRTPACNDLDFNNNGVFPEDADVVDFFDVLAGGVCEACDTIDFNNDCVFPSDLDVIAFFNVLAGGSCTP